MINNLVRILLLSNHWAVRIAFTHEKLVFGISANHTICFKSSITNLARWVATDSSYLDIVDFFSLKI